MGLLHASLETLTNNLKKECKTTKELRYLFKNTSQHFKDGEQFKLTISKGVCPYETINNYCKLYETQLPPQDAFYSSLNNSKCSDADYKKVLIVRDTFNCKTLLDYHNLYLKVNVFV